VALQQFDGRIGIDDPLIFGKPQFFDPLLLLGNQCCPIHLRRPALDPWKRSRCLGAGDMGAPNHHLGGHTAYVYALPRRPFRTQSS
jgi:hypothetical protein